MHFVAKEKKLEDSIGVIKGIGEERKKALEEAGIYTIKDLLFYAPYKYIFRTTGTKIESLLVGEEVEVEGVIEKVAKKKLRNRIIIEAILQLEDGYIKLIWFNAPKYLLSALTSKKRVKVSGKLKYYKGLQIVHPNIRFLKDYHTASPSLIREKSEILPLYNTTYKMKKAGIDSNFIWHIVKLAYKEYSEYLKTPNIDYEFLGFLSIKEAIKKLHFPTSLEDGEEARRSLAFYELFMMELYLNIVRSSLRNTKKGIRFRDDGYVKEFISSLPFELTKAQKRVIEEIVGDMTSSRIMNRLLRGDVGSGKTVVATCAGYLAIRNGYQVAFMAPTEILARQHYRNITDFFKNFRVNVALLLGSQSQKEKYSVYEGLYYGAIDMVISTHALFQEKVKFHKLGLIIVDEQHRFGVNQRRALREKGILADFLMMSATPIPRTLVMTIYGDMELSIIDELPPQRKPIKTMVFPARRRKAVYNSLEKYLSLGNQVYIVYPLIEKSETLNAISIEEHIDVIKKRFKRFNVEVIHGKLPSYEKDSIMRRFREGKIDILIATTVIETGIDVPTATIMVIENADRFGLSQLHQLRGRVGRGEKQSFCVLIASDNASKKAIERLKIIEKYQDGFKIADEDMKMRGPGDILGNKQAGMPDFKFADIREDSDIWRIARKESQKYIKKFSTSDEFLKSLVKQIKEEKGFLYIS